MENKDSQDYLAQASSVRPHDEAALIQAAVIGDVEAFCRLYESYAPNIYRYIYYRVRPQADAEDLTSQVFLNAWKAIGKYHYDKTPLLAWLYTIARNILINYSKNKNTSTIFTSLDEATDLADDNRYNNPDEQATIQADNEELREAVLKLPYEQQHVIYLRYVEEMGHAEIGRLVGKPEATVRGILFRAHGTLRKLLEKGEIFEEAN